MKNKKDTRIGIIGIGYVGLPLCLAFKKFYPVIAFDLNKKKISELRDKIDRNNQFSPKQFGNNKNIFFTHDIMDLNKCNIYIIAVPTPVKKNNIPDLSPLKTACLLVAKVLKKKDIVIFESTVYPTTTNKICIPIIEKNSRLVFNKDFYCGYSPERINPGDKKKVLSGIIKITSGSTKVTLNRVDELYKKIIKAGTYKAESMQIAEAAKIIENAQRDINIAFINEIKIIFDKMNIDINKVLKAANTKWNFINFKPGLVGGHCIGIDPYYLSFIAKKYNYNPKIILAGRKINNFMATYEAKYFLKKIKKNKIKKQYKVLILGATFKEDCSDLRNSKIIDLFKNFVSMDINTYIYDPIANFDELKYFFGNKALIKLNYKKLKFDGLFVAQKHNFFRQIGLKKFKKLCYDPRNIYDFKECFANEKIN